MNLLKRYFLYVAEQPLKRAFGIAAVLFIIFSLVRAFINGVPALSFSYDQIFNIFLIAFAILAAINIIVPAIFITYFFKDNRRAVLVRILGDAELSSIYHRPSWGKNPYAEIIFPEGWDVCESVQVQEFDLGVIFRISSRQLAFITVKNVLILNGTFQAPNLEELIRQQGPNGSKNKKFYFRKCLQEILCRYLSDRRELIKEDLVRWQNKVMTTKELEQKWIKPDIIFQGIFNNVEDWEMKLLAPEIKRTNDYKK